MMKDRCANLRVCASCEWIFRLDNQVTLDCPKCGFGHYGARYVYGRKAYRYEKTQEPWISKKMDKYYGELLVEVEKAMKNKMVDDLCGLELNKFGLINGEDI